MKVVIIDDEKAMHLIITRMLSKLNEIEIVGCFQETTAAFTYLVNHDVDLTFIDMSMPSENGLEFALRLRESGRQMKLVFVTSHRDNAKSVFDVHAYDYIVMPIDPDRLLEIVQRVRSDQA